MTPWRMATEAEIHLITGQIDQALQLYERAAAAMQSPRDVYSMYSQAIRIAAHVYGERGQRRVEQAFASAQAQTITAN
jgi:hypothetical protein